MVEIATGTGVRPFFSTVVCEFLLDTSGAFSLPLSSRDFVGLGTYNKFSCITCLCIHMFAVLSQLSIYMQ